MVPREGYQPASWLNRLSKIEIKMAIREKGNKMKDSRPAVSRPTIIVICVIVCS